MTAALSDLRPADGGSVTLPGSCARLQWVRYVQVSTNTAEIPLDELVARAPVSLPDPFWEGAECNVEPNQPQPLWLELDLPLEAPPGKYLGELTVSGRSNRCALAVSLTVRNFALSGERHQKVIQWWDFPGRTFEKLTPGSPAYWQHLERCCAFVRRHRQTDIWAQWSLVEEKKLTNGTTWDASLFEKYAETAFNAGIRAVQFGSVGRHTKYQLDPDSRTEAVEANFGRLAAVEEVVQRRGWKGRVLTGVADEPFIYHEATYGKVLERVRQAAPSVGVIEAVESDQIGGLDIYVPKLTHINLWWPRYEDLKRQGREVWFYTCCHPRGRYPNRFLDQPLVKARALHWISYLYGLDGFLHWGFNWFAADADPYSERGRDQWSLPPGDGQVRVSGQRGVRRLAAPERDAGRLAGLRIPLAAGTANARVEGAHGRGGFLAGPAPAADRVVPARGAVLLRAHARSEGDVGYASRGGGRDRGSGHGAAAGGPDLSPGREPHARGADHREHPRPHDPRREGNRQRQGAPGAEHLIQRLFY